MNANTTTRSAVPISEHTYEQIHELILDAARRGDIDAALGIAVTLNVKMRSLAENAERGYAYPPNPVTTYVVAHEMIKADLMK